jgi:hypothetical protein
VRLTPLQRWAALGTALAVTLVAIKWAASNQDLEVTSAQSPRVSTTGEPSREAQAVPHLELEKLRRPQHEAAGADPFAQRNWDLAVRAEARRNAPPPSPPAPRAPPLPFKYLGQAVEQGKVTVFLSRGDNTYIARPGDTLDGKYRVERVDERMVVFRYLPLGQRQQLALGGAEPREKP